MDVTVNIGAKIAATIDAKRSMTIFATIANWCENQRIIDAQIGATIVLFASPTARPTLMFTH